MNLFLYGTLMDEDIRHIVCGKPVTRIIPAVLKGFTRVHVGGRTYPMLLPKPHGQVDGVLAVELDQDSVYRLKIYEGWEYGLDPCRVLTKSGQKSAHLFMPPKSITPDLKPWRLDVWTLRHKRNFLPKVHQIMERALHPRLPAAKLGLRVCPVLSPPPTRRR